MTRDDIITMAREADREWDCDRDMVEWLERFAALVAAAAVRETSAEYALGWNDGQMMEREACAMVADRYHVPMCDTAADAIAAAIRARGQNDN